jgi:streptomycin 6-kinase
MSVFIPQPLQNIMLSKGTAGEQWLENLPRTLQKIEHEWQITLGAPFAECYCNYVAPAKTSDGQSTVLKLSFPDQDFTRELAYLRLYQNGLMPQVLKVDESIAAILLEKIEPAQDLTTVNEEEAVRVAADVMKQLWQVHFTPQPFHTTEHWYDNFVTLKEKFADEKLLSPELINKAEQAYKKLEEEPQEKILLHGDLHHYNILFDQQKGWRVIDPAGIIGERAFEVASFLKNPDKIGSLPNVQELLEKRIFTFAQLLEIDPKRLYLAGLFFAVLSVWWATEDKSEIGQDFIRVAEELEGLEFE